MAGTYTILICDDEPSTRFGLRDTCPWASLGIQPLGVAADGEEALDIVFQCNPDIILTDVRMPFMDGLQLVETLKSIGYTGKVVFISAFGEVEYLKKAFTLDAVDYVLKPISLTELKEVMARVVAKLEAEKAQESRLERSLPLLRDQFAQSLVLGLSPESPDPSVEADALGLTFVPGEPFRLWLLAPDKPEDLDRTRDLVRERFTAEALSARVGDRMVGLVPVRLFTPDQWKIALDVFWTDLHQVASATTLVYSPEIPDLESVAEAYSEALVTLAALTKPPRQPVASGTESGDHGPRQGDNLRLVVERVKRLVNENAKQGLSVRWLAREVGLSYTYLCMLFKKQTGLTLGEYQTQVKIDLAKVLLADHRKKSYDVGYNNPGYFARTFKRVTGMSPIEYRDSVIAGQP